MSTDASIWAPASDRGRALVPEVGAWVIAPDESWLAWAEAPSSREVRVTDLSSMRTALSLSGQTIAALYAPSPDTLWVLRRKGPDATLHVHAVPDGGELARVALPNVGVWSVTIQASFDGRAAVIGKALRGNFNGRLVSANYLLRGAALDEVTAFDPFALVARGARELVAKFALDPDGRALAIAHAPCDGPDPRVRVSLLHLVSNRVDEVATLGAGVTADLRWISSSRVFVAVKDDSDKTSLHTVDLERGATRLAQLSALDQIPGDNHVSVHPDRDRALVLVERARDRSRSTTRSVAMVCSLDAATAPALIGLANDKGVVGSKRHGSACWDREGRLLTLTSPRPREAHLSRRDAISDSPRAITHLPLAGASPSDLALSLSPRGVFAVVRWCTRDRGEAATVRRLALVIL